MIKKNVVTMLLLSILAASCEDDTPEVLTPAEAKLEISTLNNSMSGDIMQMTSSQGYEALLNLFDITNDVDPFGGRMYTDVSRSKRVFKSAAKRLKSIFIPNKSVTALKLDEHDGFHFEDNWGIYVYDPTVDEFEKLPDVVEMIIIRFPTEGSETNNAELRITDYEEILIVEEDDGFVDEYFTPTLLKADLSVNDELLIDLSIELEYNEGGDPVAGDASLFIKPYTFTINFDDTQNTVSTLSASIDREDTRIVAIDVTVNFQTALKEEVTTLSGAVSYLNIALEGSIDVAGMEEALDANEDADPNEFINLILTSNGRKIGDIVLIEEVIDEQTGEEDYVPYVQYSDGSQERLEDALETVVAELEEFFDELEELEI